MTCSGIYTALITPFKPSGEIDLDGICRLVERQQAAAIDGLLALGSTGEAPTLSHDEKELVVTTVRAMWDGPLMVGCGAYSTTQTIENIQDAADWGADMALVVTPFYNKPTQEGVFRHFEAITSFTPIPVMVYNHPGRTGVNIEIETMKRIAELPNIIGVKETAGSIPQISDLIYSIKQHRPAFSIMSGDDNMTFPLMVLGGDGVICGTSNLFPETVMDFYRAFKSGDIATAREINLSLTPLFKALLVETNPIPLKAIMHLAGLPAGHPRLPLTPLQSKFIPLLKEVLEILPQSTQSAQRG